MTKAMIAGLIVLFSSGFAHAQVHTDNVAQLLCKLTIDGPGERVLIGETPETVSFKKVSERKDMREIHASESVKEAYQSSVYFLTNLVVDAKSGEQKIIIGVYSEEQMDSDLVGETLYETSSNGVWFAKPVLEATMNVDDDFLEMNLARFQGSTFVKGTTLRCDKSTSSRQNRSQ